MFEQIKVWIQKILHFLNDPVQDSSEYESNKPKSWLNEQMKEETVLANKVLAVFEKMYSEENDFFSISIDDENGKEYAVCSFKPGTNTSFSLSFWAENYIADCIKTIIEKKDPAFAKRISSISVSCEGVVGNSCDGKPVYEDLFWIAMVLEKNENADVVQEP